jgi:hypothetical protein
MNYKFQQFTSSTETGLNQQYDTQDSEFQHQATYRTPQCTTNTNTHLIYIMYGMESSRAEMYVVA